MEVLNARCAPFCNYEVLLELRKLSVGKKAPLRNLATITYETLHYLNESIETMQNASIVGEFLKDIAFLKLYTNEILSIINNPPTTALHVQLIEESEERFSEAQVNCLLTIVAKHFKQIK